MELYWNYATGGVECEKSNNNCLIVKSPYDNGIVTESWWTDYTHTHIIYFNYLRDFYDRNIFFKNNNIDPQDLRWIMIPKSEYEQLVERELEISKLNNYWSEI